MFELLSKDFNESRKGEQFNVYFNTLDPGSWIIPSAGSRGRSPAPDAAGSSVYTIVYSDRLFNPTAQGESRYRIRATAIASPA
ncbi:hypothetical protein EVAR_68891_1 [Eumeta japonica]|uniref:Uncharacterized protein n=1 Tax=Eumeta variegata TaxID=151549 RepID=A0A4C1ZVY1_EUMVA|nr:hypothetical protein EVAR_68891_1 [Eumeta japonica]